MYVNRIVYNCMFEAMLKTEKLDKKKRRRKFKSISI